MCDFFKAAAKLFKEDEKYKLKENQLIIEKIYATKNKKDLARRSCNFQKSYQQNLITALSLSNYR